MIDDGIRAIALFFFYASLDASKSATWAARAADLYRAKLKRNPKLSRPVAVAFATSETWKRLRQEIKRGHPNTAYGTGFTIPTNVDLSAWAEFQRTSPEEELLMVIWTRILKIPTSELSAGLGLSEGTIRFRSARGLARLGSLTQLQNRGEASS